MFERFGFRQTLVAAAGTALAIGVLSSSAEAVVFPFEVFNLGGTTFTGEVDVQDAGGGTVTFAFTNTTPAPATPVITDVYFEDRFNTIIASANISGETGVDFSAPATPANLPGGNTIGFNVGSFTFASFDADPPPAGNGIANNGTDELVITANLIAGQTFANVLAQMIGGVGVHVQSGCGDSDPDSSCSAVTVPLPAAAWLFLSAIAGLFGLNRWTRRKEETGALAA